MPKRSLLHITLVLMVILGMLHFLAEAYYFYWTVWWFDNLTHFLGGLIGGLVIVWFLYDSSHAFKHKPTLLEASLYSLFGVLIIGIAWEVFEYQAGITGFEPNYSLDTASDLVFDLLGALAAAFWGVKEHFRIRHNG